MSMAMLPDVIYNECELRIRNNLSDIAQAEYALKHAKGAAEKKSINNELAILHVWRACIDKVISGFEGSLEADIARILWSEHRSMDEAASELYVVRQTVRRAKERIITHVAVEALKEGLLHDDER